MNGLRRRLARTCALLALASLSCGAAGLESIAFHYGALPPLAEMSAFEVAVVDPDHVPRPPQRMPGPARWAAYLSVNEVQPSRAWFADLPARWLIGENAAWGARIIDQAQPGWPAFFVDRLVAPLWQRGYRSFFLDTLDSYQIAVKDEAGRRAQEQGMVALLRLLKQRYPQAELILNRGFEILPYVAPLVAAVAAESLYRGWDPGNKAFREVPEADRNWLRGQLERVRLDFGKPAIAIDYLPARERELARQTARRIAADGYVPWVATPELDTLGVSAIEVLPRRVLALYSRREHPDVAFSEVHRFVALPLNYLGYAVDYADIESGLPAYRLAGRYAGVVTWVNNAKPAAGAALAAFIERQIADGVPVAFLGEFGIAPQRLGLAAGADAQAPRSVRVGHRAAMIGFETPVYAERANFSELGARGGEALLTLLDERGRANDAVALMPWGGYARPGHGLRDLPNAPGQEELQRWVVDPFEFLRRALRLPDMPVPDVTTDAGRRLMLVHIDGDGFPSRAELPGTPLAGEALYTEILLRYRIPTTASIIQAEIAANGLYPGLSARLETAARRIFALPHVEIASHSFSHPFRWSIAREAASGRVEQARDYALAVKNYSFDLQAETRGSIDYINARLAPPGKQARMFLWTGDANPPAEALRAVQDAGVLNMNGGYTVIDKLRRGVANVGPLGIQRGEWFQVYAPVQNENLYTNLWTGPYYGFRRVIETLQLTDRPRRLKPINLYYHSYSASKPASLAALREAYDWSLGQSPQHVFASEYAHKVLDFRSMLVVRDAEGFRVHGAGNLRQLRAPRSLGYPAVGVGSVAGWLDAADGRYLHLALDSARLRFTPQPANGASLAHANARVASLSGAPDSLELSFEGHMPLEFALRLPPSCAVSHAGRVLAARRIDDGFAHFTLPSNAVRALQIRCI